MCNVFKIRSTVSLVPTSGIQPDLKELGPFSGTPTRILVTPYPFSLVSDDVSFWKNIK